MAHIHTQEGQHDSTVSACIVLEQEAEEPRVWLHKHKKLGFWLQFGGHVELDETPWQAVIHEVAEESGYDITQLKLLQPKLRITSLPTAKLHPQPVVVNTHNFSDTHFHSDLTYAFVTSEQPNNGLSGDESKDLRAMTAHDIRAIPAGEIPEDARQIILFTLESLLSAWERVATDQYVL